jgi:predicted transglutaminase-like cysteine proteinase
MWNRLAQLRWWWRCPVKTALLAAVVLVVLFPHPVLFVRELQALRNDEPLIQPQMRAMAEINREIDKSLPESPTREQQFKAVERFVYQKIKYQYDWYNWGNLDYWPTAEEVWARQKEDCDGRAVLCASILRARGFPTAKIVANLNHAWVAVDQDELMGPQAEKNLRREGGKVIVTLPGWRTWMDSFAFISQFPAGRSLLILFAVVILAYHPCKHVAGFFGVTTMALTGFVLLFHWGTMRMGREVSGADGESYTAALLLLGALVLAWTMPWWLGKVKGSNQ